MNRDNPKAALLALDVGVRQTGWAIFCSGRQVTTGMIGIRGRRGIDAPANPLGALLGPVGGRMASGGGRPQSALWHPLVRPRTGVVGNGPLGVVPAAGRKRRPRCSERRFVPNRPR